MPTPSTRMGLRVPATTDRFSTADVAYNWQQLDKYPGIYVCTSGTRPVWGANQAGMVILESNTGLPWEWDGTNFIRAFGGNGILKRSDGSYAVGERTSDFTTSSTDPRIAIAVTNVVVPDGHRTLMYVATWQNADNSQGDHFQAWIYRSNTPGTGPVIGKWRMTDGGGSMVMFQRGGLAPGTYDFSFQINSNPSPGGASTVSANSTTPTSIAVIEL